MTSAEALDRPGTGEPAPTPAVAAEWAPDRSGVPSWTVVTGGVLVVVAWFLVSLGQPELLLPSPARTAQAVVELARSGVLVDRMVGTLTRGLWGVGLALAVGLPWGLAAGASAVVAGLSEVALRGLMAVPPVLFVVLAMIWLGPGVQAVVLVTTLVGLPLMVVTTREAVRGVDPDLVEMGRAFRLGRWRRVRHIVIPAATPPVLAGLSVLLGQSLRITVMAELLAASTGIGHELALSRTNLDTAALFAWAMVLALLAFAVEMGVVRPLSRRTRHRT